MRLNAETKIFFGIIFGSIVLILAAAFLLTKPEKGLSREELIPSGTHTKGKTDASVYLVEFSDFQCPACKAFKPYVDEVVKKYEDKLLFAYRYYPIMGHPFAFKSAEVAEIASALGGEEKFWETYDYLFNNQDRFSDEFLSESWKALKLDEKKFTDALSSQKYRQKIQDELAKGTGFGVSGTPTFFLNGKKLTLTSYDELEKEVQKAIEQAR